MLAIGRKAPSFAAKSTKGNVNLDDYLKRRPIVLIFYPGDDTAICTAQLCAVRDSKSRYDKYNAAVFGINRATLESHQHFSNKFLYDFPLIVDEGEKISRLYDVGKILRIRPRRIVFVMDLQGNIVYAKKGNRPTEEILQALE